MLDAFVSLVDDAVAAAERVPHPQAGFGGDFGTDRDREILRPDGPFRHRGPVPVEEFGRGAYDSVAAVGVARAQGHGVGDDRVFGVEKGLHFPERDVARRVPDLVH